MGNNQKSQNHPQKLNTIKTDKERIDEAFLDVYIIGKYDRIMDVLIGKRKDTIKQFYRENNEIIEVSEEIDKISDQKINMTKTIKEQNEEKNENLLFINNNNEIKQNEINEQENSDFIEYLDNFLNNEKQINSNNNILLKNSTFNWLFHFYCKNGFTIEYIMNIKDEIDKNIFEKKNNVLIAFVDSISEIYKTLDIFKSINKEFHPLFLFIINGVEEEIKKDEILENIKKYVYKNKIKMFEMRNISIKNRLNLEKILNKDIVKSYILEMYLYLINAWFYYNNFGDDFAFEDLSHDNLNILLKELTEQQYIKPENENKSKVFFNILILGRPGVGKSTLVNLLCNSKRSMEGKGINVTRFITKYVIKEYNISIYDTPGFEFDSEVNTIKLKIEELNEHLLKKKNQIHLVFYLLNAKSERYFYNNEKEILKILMKNKLQTFFLLTFCPDKEFGEEIKEVVEKELKTIFYKFGQQDWDFYFKNKTKIFPVHLLDEMDGTKNFGLKTVLEEAYNQFENCIIDEDDLKELQENLKNFNTNKKNDEYEIIEVKSKKSKIFDILNKNGNTLYKYIQEIDDVIDSAKAESLSTINNYSIVCCLLGVLGIIVTTYPLKFCKKNLVLKLAENFKKVINDEEKNDLVKLNSDKINEDSIWIYIPLVSSITNTFNIQQFGKYYLDEYSKELNEEALSGLAIYLIDIINCYNNSIKSLKILGKLFNE